MQTLTDYEKQVVLPADDDSVLSPVTVADGTFLPDGQPDVPRILSVLVTTSTVTAGFVTINGVDVNGDLVVESFDLSMAVAYNTTAAYASVTSIVVTDLADEDPADTIQAGTTVTAQLWAGKGVIASVIVPQTTNGYVEIIDNITGSTTNVATLTSGIAAGVYKLKASIGSGLRVIIQGTKSILITYYR